MSNLDIFKKAISCPNAKLITGHTKEFQKDPLGFLKKVSSYGEVVKLRFGPFQNAYLISNPEMIKEVLVTKHKYFVKSKDIQSLKTLFGDGLLTSEKDTHMRQRRLIQPAFKPSHITTYGNDMIAITQDYLSKWKHGVERNITQEMMDITLSIITKTMFSTDLKEGSSTVGEPIETTRKMAVKRMGALVTFPLWFPTKNNLKYRNAIDKLDSELYKIIEKRRQSKQKYSDMLGILMDARDADDGNGMTDKQVRDEVMTIFLAGHETTANALSWTWYLLSQNPESEQKLFQEIDSVIGSRNVVPGDFMKLSYTQNVILESMRVFPPVFLIGRDVEEKVEIGGYHFKKGDTILISQFLMHHNPEYFPDPEDFHPDRFENNFVKTIPAFAYFPFGGGPRVCIGNHFAMMEAVLVLATILQRYKLKLTPNHHPVIPHPAITLRPRNGLRMIPEERKKI